MKSHEPDLRSEINDDEQIQQIQADYRQADLAEQQKRMLDYARKLTLHPDEMNVEDVRTLSEAGYSDQAILEIAQLTGYFNYINRVMDGLGIELEPEMTSNTEDSETD